MCLKEPQQLLNMRRSVRWYAWGMSNKNRLCWMRVRKRSVSEKSSKLISNVMPAAHLETVWNTYSFFTWKLEQEETDVSLGRTVICWYSPRMKLIFNENFVVLSEFSNQEGLWELLNVFLCRTLLFKSTWNLKRKILFTAVGLDWRN